ncbi:unnamed protein product [Durusdinium trenchii]|uniref:Uncharacterized protein n=1 Tax=Durusdinium trenchii TaxID=1381693 RepID=A0ABP0IGP3_9DINO
MATDALELRVSDALKRAPFVIFSKEAPASLDDFSMDDSFQYFYFNDLMQTLSGLSPSFLTNGRNAKTDFPEDFEAYFSDDVDVCKSFLHPKIKIIFEPWRTPLRSTVLATRKTAMTFQDRLFMLGCFSPVDDMEMSFTDFSTTVSFPELPDLGLPVPWQLAAFEQLPNAMAILDGDLVVQNHLARATRLVPPSKDFAFM